MYYVLCMIIIIIIIIIMISYWRLSSSAVFIDVLLSLLLS